ncbi:hypothetical protein VPH35_003284 [Triticum aestivum]
MYSALEDSTRIHPEEVDDDTLEKWLSSITGNKDNPRGARRVPPFDQSRAPEQAIIEMYSVPNGEQEALEGEASGGESGEWTSDGEGDGGSDDSSDGEEVESPPRIERRSKLDQERPSAHDKATAQAGQSSKRPRVSSPTPTEKAPKHPKVAEPKTRKALPKIKIDIPVTSAAATSGTSAYRDDDEVMEDVVTSNPAPNIIDLPDDDEEPERSLTRKSRRAPVSEALQSMPRAEPVVEDTGDVNRGSVTFVEPLSSALPSSSTAQAPVDPPSVFVTHHVPEDEVNAAREAIRQAGIMMEKMKMVRDASQAAYDASSALQSNVQKSCDLGARFADLEKQQIQLNLDLELARTELQKVRDCAAEKLREALAKKDQDLAAARKEADDKTALAEQKLASVGQLEEENTRLKTALNEANRECTRWKKDNLNLNEKMEGIARRRDDLESYLRSLAKKLYIKLEEFCQNFEEETGRIEPGLDPINSPVKDETAMNLLRLESRIDGAVDYLARLKVAMSRIDPALWPEATLQNNLESLMTRLNGIPDRVQECKKSSARCGADVALSLVRVHCKEVRQDKLAAIKVANTQKHDFRTFMETFIAAATRIADGVDLDEFVEPASPPPAE